MRELSSRLQAVRARIASAAAKAGRPADAVRLLAVSKTRTAEDVRALYAAGQRAFGENYVQEAEAKMAELADLAIDWHHIGRIQGNKTRAIRPSGSSSGGARGDSPAWVTENNLWMADQSVETWDGKEGCFEHMQDPKCLYSHVRVIENPPARVVVHWRYAPVSAYNHLWNIDERTAWGLWVDEMYYFYPDQTGIRQVSWQTGSLGKPSQFQESIVLAHPGQVQGDVINADYVTVANLKGEKVVFSYVKDPPKQTAKAVPADPTNAVADSSAAAATLGQMLFFDKSYSGALTVGSNGTSSIWVATELVKHGQADAVVSPGNTGASMVASFFVLGLMKGVERPAIATSLPTLSGEAIMLDVGANVDCTATHLEQFALMGNEYGKHLLGKPNPRVGLLSIGEEDSKGNEVTKEALKLLKGSSMNFVGNVEGRDVYRGIADIVVCDGFIGNVALKISEGVAEMIKRLLLKELSGHFLGRLAYPLIAGPLRNLKRKIDYAEFGGAPLLGVNGITMICHARSSAKAIKNAIRRAKGMAEGGVRELIQRDIEESRSRPPIELET